MTSDPAVQRARELIDLLLEKAEGCRQKGITRLRVGDLEADLAYPEAEPKDGEEGDGPLPIRGDLDHPELYPGGVVPRFRRRIREESR